MPTVEFVGLAAVGKSHLVRRLREWYGGRALDLSDVPLDPWDLVRWIGALVSVAPIAWFTLREGRTSFARRWRFCRRLVTFAYRMDVATRGGEGDVVLVEEGWFHKLRQVRRMTGGTVTFAAMPPGIQRRLVGSRLVVVLTADPEVICARKLQRRNRPVTPESVLRQYDQSAAIGQWTELDLTLVDLHEARDAFGQHSVVVDHGDQFEFDDDLVTHLRGHALA